MVKSFTIQEGDVLEQLKLQPEMSFDGCLTDPPYHLTQASRNGSPRMPNAESPFGRHRNGDKGFMGKTWDGGDVAFRPETWAEVLRCLKPGAMLLAFGGTRTHHRLMCAIEDAGFEIRDCCMWLYGSGFPKSMDISKAIDKAAGAERLDAIKGGHLGLGHRAGDGPSKNELGTRRTHTIDAGRVSRGSAVTADAATWSGYGTALKPAWEPIIVAMRPFAGTFAENALTHGVAGLSIDACRIESGPIRKNTAGGGGFDGGFHDVQRGTGTIMHDSGRWPANFLLDEESAAALDRQSGLLRNGGQNASSSARAKAGNLFGVRAGVSEFAGDSGGASRFFYTAKASTSERGDGNTHPTVKPTELASYLAKLILPPERDGEPRRLLVPFSGSGSEIIGALAVGWEYALIARRRIIDDAPLWNCEVAACQ